MNLPPSLLPCFPTEPQPRFAAILLSLALLSLHAHAGDLGSESPPPPRPPTLDGCTATPIKLKRSRPAIDPNLVRGYEALQAGQLEAARQAYEQARSDDPKSIDVLLGLAAIAQHQGRSPEADRYRREALEANPKDAMAQAAAADMVPADSGMQESRLKNLLAAQPESGPLSFSLGNLYSRQQRWAEAQQMYFNAVAVDHDNPDYLFNLAVSLDRLRQSRLAAQHYGLALTAAGRRPAAFDRGEATRRLHELQPQARSRQP